MIKQDLFHTKWDARDWSDEMKRKWEARVSELGFYWFVGCDLVATSDICFYFLNNDGHATATLRDSNYTDKFFELSHQECAYSLLFPKTITEQGQKHDSEKPRYDLLPPVAIDEMAKVMTFGAKKYAPDNWRHVDNAVERYRAALLRHSFAMLRGEKLDPETGLPHAAHAMCCAAFLAELDT